MNYRALKAEAHNVLDQQRALVDKVIAEKRNFRPSETKEWDRLDSRFHQLRDLMKKEKEKFPDACRSGFANGGELYNPNTEKRSSKLDDRKVIHEMRALEKAVAEDDYVYRENGDSLRDAFNRYLKYGWSAVDSGSARNLQADADTSGGFATVPLKIIQKLIHGFNNEVFIRRYASIFPVPDAMSLGAPELNADMGDLTWTTELRTGSEDSDMDLRRRDLIPHPLARRIRVSNKFMRLSVIPPEELISQRFQYVLGTVLESNYLTGTGNSQPLGVLTASNDGISTGRDVSTYNTSSGGPSADNLIACVGELKSQYRKNARWILHRSTEEAVRRLKSGTGDYLWKAGLDGNPNTLLGFPVHLSEYMTDCESASSGDYVAILADFSWYWIADALNMQIKRLDELYQETDQTGFIVRYEGDGAPVLEDAFVRSQLA
jgi:HK97 family phage major capsid protein